MQVTKQREGVMVSKELLNAMVNDIENLLDDIERIVEQDRIKVVDKRLKDIKEKRVKGLTKKNFSGYLRKRDVDAG